MIWIYPLTFWFLLFVAVVVAAVAFKGRQNRKRLQSIGRDSVERQVRSFLRDFTMMVFMVLVVLAAAEPHSGRKSVEGENSGLDIAVAFDVSRSMLTQDISPNRLGRGIAALGQITRSIEGFRFSLTPFKGDAIPLLPMTEDRVVLEQWIERLGPGLMTVGGTNIESALTVALKSFPEGVGRNKLLLVISDGESLSGRTDRIAREFVSLNIPVHVLLVGTPEGGGIPLGNGNYVKDASGRQVISQADGSLLSQLAKETGGSYHELNRPGVTAELIAIIQGNREFSKLQGIKFTGIYQYRTFLIPALLFLLFNLIARIFPWDRR